MVQMCKNIFSDSTLVIFLFHMLTLVTSWSQDSFRISKHYIHVLGSKKEEVEKGCFPKILRHIGLPDYTVKCEFQITNK